MNGFRQLATIEVRGRRYLAAYSGGPPLCFESHGQAEMEAEELRRVGLPVTVPDEVPPRIEYHPR